MFNHVGLLNLCLLNVLDFTRQLVIFQRISLVNGINTVNVNARMIINSTNIHEIAQVNNRGWLRETYYVCQQISRQQ